MPEEDEHYSSAAGSRKHTAAPGECLYSPCTYCICMSLQLAGPGCVSVSPVLATGRAYAHLLLTRGVRDVLHDDIGRAVMFEVGGLEVLDLLQRAYEHTNTSAITSVRCIQRCLYAPRYSFLSSTSFSLVTLSSRSS